MATPNDRKRVSLVPDVPAYDPAAAAAPTTPRSRPGSALDRLGGAIRRTPGEVADYARDVVRNPLRELGTATAPLVGAGGSVRTAAAGLRSLPSRAALAQSQVQAGQVLRNARPSLGQLFSGGAAASSAGLALGIDDAAHKEQQAAAARPEFSNVVSGANSMPAVISPTSTAAGDAYVQVGDRQPRRIRVSQAERDASREAAAAQADRLQPVAASANTAPNVYETTRRTARDIDSAALNTRGRITSALLNPMGNDAELLRRLQNSQSSYFNKGRPSARKAIAEAYLGALAGGREADMAGLKGQTDAFLGGADNEATADESFASRRDSANQFNVETSETRRQNDASNTLKAAEIVADAARPRGISRGGATGDPNVDFASGIYEDVLKISGDPGAAMEAARQAQIDAGLDPSASPYVRAANTGERDRIDSGLRDYADRWFAGGTQGFDSASAVPEERSWLGRTASAAFHPGRRGSDVLWRDSAGREAFTPREALGNASVTEMRLRRQRELALRNRE